MPNREGFFGEENIKPSFLSLKNAEHSALDPDTNIKESITRETTPAIQMNNTPRQKSNRIVSKTPTKKHFSLKKSIPAFIITLLLGFGAFTLFNSNSLLAPHLEALYTEATDTQFASGLFRTKYLKIAPKHGRVSGFFDKPAEKIYQKLGLSRNIFKNFKSTGDTEADESAYRKTMKDLYDGDSDTRINTVQDETKTDEDGKETKSRQKTGEDASTKSIAGNEATTKARSYLSGITSKVAGGANVGCAVLKVGSLVSAAVAANELYQSMNYFMNTMESISKMKAGEGTTSAVNETLNHLTEKTTTKITDPETEEEIELTGSSLDSEGARIILGNSPANKKKANYFSLERLQKSALLAGTTFGATYTACNIARATDAAISLATSAVPGGGFVRVAVGLLVDTAVATGVTLAIGGVLSAMIPHIASALFSNAFEKNVGIAAGELRDRGASAANTRVARSASGQMPASSDQILEYNSLNNRAVALEAESDRARRNPFDLTSKNTFLGSIASKFMFISSTSNLTSALNSLGNITQKSLASLTGVFAAGTDTTYMTTFGDCPNLEKLGVKGDIYCNPITTTDTSTIKIDENDPTYRAVLEPNLEYDENGKTKIKDNSNLARFIIYCTERDSPFGIQDANIANSLEKSLGIVGDNMPILGDVVDIVNAIESEVYEGWVDGSICANSSKNPYWEREMKYYQRYIEDRRILTREELEDENPVTAFKDAYYEQNPLDNSRAGYLARISGITKNDAEVVIAMNDYLALLDSYNPKNVYNFTDTNTPKQTTKNLYLLSTDNQPVNLFSRLPKISSENAFVRVAQENKRIIKEPEIAA